MILETRRRRVRRQRLEAGFLDEWRPLVAAHVRHWPRLSAEQRDRMEALTLHLVAHKAWEAANGFELTDEMVVVIAAQAALLGIELPDDPFRGVYAIVVHPTTMVVHGERAHGAGGGVVARGPLPILGQASLNGPVLVAWDAVAIEARNPGDGHNVVFHEFAHKLDMLTGVVNGTPPMASRTQLDDWVRVCTRTFRQVRAGGGGRTMRPYAGVSPAEFFAVATEAFFDAPVAQRAEHPDLYRVLQGYYRQDPAARLS